MAAESLRVDTEKFPLKTLLKGMNVEIEHSDLIGEDAVKAAKIALAHLKERVDYYEKLDKCVEKKNASDFPKYYYTRHMQAGLCGYEDETILVDTDAVVKLGNTFKGKPVYIQHQDVKMETLKEDAVGYVQNTFMGVDGWLWSEIMITDDEAHEVIAKGWAVSNAYIPTEWGPEGSKNNLPYDREVLNGEFTHLALVPNPRYEGAKIYTPGQYQARNTQLVNSLANSKPQPKKGFVMKFWKKEEVSDASTADFVEYTNGKGETVTKSVEEMKNALEAEAKQAEVQAKKVLVNGKEMTVAELTKAYEKLNAKKNESHEKDEKENEDDEGDEDEKENDAELVTETRVNEDDEDMENEDDEDEKKNSHFKTMKNAHMKNSTGRIVIETRAAQIQRGRELFSRQKGN